MLSRRATPQHPCHCRELHPSILVITEGCTSASLSSWKTTPQHPCHCGELLHLSILVITEGCTSASLSHCLRVFRTQLSLRGCCPEFDYGQHRLNFSSYFFLPLLLFFFISFLCFCSSSSFSPTSFLSGGGFKDGGTSSPWRTGK